MAPFKQLKAAPPETRRNFMRRVVMVLMFDGLIALLLMACAGTLGWLAAWAYIVIMVVVQLVGLLSLPLEVVAERGRRQVDSEKWDRVVSGLIIPFFMAIYPVAGLDHRRQWSPDSPAAVQVIGAVFFALGCALQAWAMHANAFFSSAVRIQSERGHTVCDTGPYRYVRHPGYVGMILTYGASPIFLGSLWALVPAVGVGVVFVIRTALEDRTLHEKLPDYADYAARVRYRLLPGIW